MSEKLSRRQFLAQTAATTAGLTVAGSVLAQSADAAGKRSQSQRDGDSEQRASSSSSNSLAVGFRATITSLTPFAVQGYQWSNMVGYTMYDTLVKISADGTLLPWIATSWDTSSPTSTVIHVRPGVKFQNGQPVTAADVAYSIAARSDPKLVAQTNGRAAMTPDQWVSSEVLNTYTVRINTKSRTQILTQPQPLLVVPNNAYTKYNLNTQAVGSGPFIVKQFVSGSSLTFTANPNYWAGAPPIKNLSFNLFSDVASEVLNLRSGQIDAVYDVDPLYIKQLSTVPNKKSLSEATYADWWIIQFGEPPLNNPAVRTALRYCFNMDLINKAVFDGLGRNPWDPFRFFPAAYHTAPPTPWTYDPDKAKSLLKKAGASNITVPLLGIDTYQDSIDEGQIIEQGLKAAGVNSSFSTQPLDTWIDTLYTKGSWKGLAFNAGQLPFPFSNVWSYLVDPSSILSSFTKGDPYPPAANLLNAINSAPPSQQAALCRQAEHQILSDTAAYFMFGGPVVSLVPKNLMGVQVNGYGDVRWNSAHFA
jgi:peptide/nickel transport system substrate-binding protein